MTVAYDSPHLQREFDSLCRACLRDVSAQQYRDLRRFFFAGAAVMLNLQMTLLSEGPDATEADVEAVKSLQSEILEFNEAVKRQEK